MAVCVLCLLLTVDWVGLRSVVVHFLVILICLFSVETFKSTLCKYNVPLKSYQIRLIVSRGPSMCHIQNVWVLALTPEKTKVFKRAEKHLISKSCNS